MTASASVPSSEGASSGHHPTAALRTLVWAALGVVFGDVGTSPLYAMSETVSSHLASVHGIKEKVELRIGEHYGPDEVLGWTSLFFWAIAIVVTLKYVVLIMRADNKGEGGLFSILALLLDRAKGRFTKAGLGAVIALAVIGSGLILGDGVITPSLSIMSAWEGLEVVTHRWSPYIPVLSVVTLVALFGIQRFGTAKVGAIFAPAMAVWFTCLALMGAHNLAKHPEVLSAINPAYAARYMWKFPKATLFVVGSVDLCITGCEALYADMGHFSRPAVRRAWFFIVWPALVLNYLGQGARLLDPAPIAEGNVFYALVPSTPGFVYTLVVVSWLATVIASQALISGAFSLIKQAVQLGLFPRTSVVHTSHEVEGQIYVPEVNWAYLALCITLVLAFRSSHALAPAYGLAVTGTMAFTTVLFFFVATRVWGWKVYAIGPVCALLVLVDIAFFASNATQFFEGGYVTIALAIVVAFVMFTWRKGRHFLSLALQKAAMPLDVFLPSLALDPPTRVRGTAVFMTSNPGAPPCLMHFLKHARTLHEKVVLLTIQTLPVPAVPESERIAAFDDLGDGISFCKLAFGFGDIPDIPKALELLGDRGITAGPDEISYFLGRESLVFTKGASTLSLPRKVFFKFLSQNAATASTFFRLPPGRVVELGMQVEI